MPEAAWRVAASSVQVAKCFCIVVGVVVGCLRAGDELSRLGNVPRYRS